MLIARILGEGQFALPDADLDRLNELDDALERAVVTEDTETFPLALHALLAEVRALGSPLPADDLRSSDLVLPGADSHLDDVRLLLGAEGLIPG